MKKLLLNLIIATTFFSFAQTLPVYVSSDYVCVGEIVDVEVGTRGIAYQTPPSLEQCNVAVGLGFSYIDIDNNTFLDKNICSFEKLNNTIVTSLQPGSNHQIEVGTNGYGVTAWIDYNMNGIFEKDETLFQNPTTNNASTSTFKIPEDVYPGVTRLRIMTLEKRIAEATEAQATFSDLGEYRDYYVNIVSDNFKYDWDGISIQARDFSYTLGEDQTFKLTVTNEEDASVKFDASVTVEIADEFTVTKTTDGGQGVCGELRTVLNKANESADKNVILFDKSLNGEELIWSQDFSDFIIKGDVELVGPSLKATIKTEFVNFVQVADGVSIEVSNLIFKDAYINSESGLIGSVFSFDGKTNSSFSNCEFIENGAESDAVIGTSNIDAELSFDNCIFSASPYAQGGNDGKFINMKEARSLTVKSSSFSGSSVNQDGGAIYFTGGGTVNSSIEISNSQFTSNSALSGGAIYIGNTNDISINQSQFYDNTASYYGGGVVLEGTNVIVEGSTFERNNAGVGGGMWVDFSDGNLNVSNTNFSNNISEYSGGGIQTTSNETDVLNLQYVSFVGNKTTYNDGGGMFLGLCDANADHVTFSHNSSGGNGAAIFMSILGVIDDNNTTSKPAATLNYGVRLTNSTIFKNTTGSLDGAAVHLFDGSLTLKNTIIGENEITGIECDDMCYSDVYVTDNNIVSEGFNILSEGFYDSNIYMDNDLYGESSYLYLHLTDSVRLDNGLYANYPSDCSPAIDNGDQSIGGIVDLSGEKIHGQLDNIIDAGAIEALSSDLKSPLAVDNYYDSYECGTLRNAIGFANAKNGYDTITFVRNTDPYSYYYLSMSNEYPELQITDDLSIIGSEDIYITIDATGDNSLFTVTNGVSFYLSNLSMSSYTYQPTNLDFDGGFIHLDTNTNSIIENVFISSATAYNGGAIYVGFNSSLEINNSEFYNLTAHNNGGAIYGSQNSQISLNFSTFTGNSYSTQNGEGGVVYTEGQLNSFGCTYSDNSNINGGVFALYGNETDTIINNFFTNNIVEYDQEPRADVIYAESDLLLLHNTFYYSSFEDSENPMIVSEGNISFGANVFNSQSVNPLILNNPKSLGYNIVSLDAEGQQSGYYIESDTIGNAVVPMDIGLENNYPNISFDCGALPQDFVKEPVYQHLPLTDGVGGIRTFGEFTDAGAYELPVGDNPLIVSTSLDNSYCGTIRSAINYANNNPGLDTIIFDLKMGDDIIYLGFQWPTITDSLVIIGDEKQLVHINPHEGLTNAVIVEGQSPILFSISNLAFGVYHEGAIKVSNLNLFEVKDSYFQLEAVYNGGEQGIIMDHVAEGIIQNNFFGNYDINAIGIDSSSNISIVDNKFGYDADLQTENEYGYLYSNIIDINIDHSDFIDVTSNYFVYSATSSVEISNAENITIDKNYFGVNTWDTFSFPVNTSIKLNDVHKSTIANNYSVSYQNFIATDLLNSLNSDSLFIANNTLGKSPVFDTIYENSNGMNLSGIDYSLVSNNSIFNSSNDAITINGSSNRIYKNQFMNNNATALYVENGEKNQISQNEFICNGASIELNPQEQANLSYTAPSIESVSTTSIEGIALAGDTVEVFFADTICQEVIGGREYIGSAVTDNNGQWNLPGDFPEGGVITTTATSFEGNTSGFSDTEIIFNCTDFTYNFSDTISTCDSDTLIQLGLNALSYSNTFYDALGQVIDYNYNDSFILSSDVQVVVMANSLNCIALDTFFFNRVTYDIQPNAGSDVNSCGDSSRVIATNLNYEGANYWMDPSGLYDLSTPNSIATDVLNLPIDATIDLVWVFDTQGCMATDTVSIFTRAPFEISDSVVSPTCYDSYDGKVYMSYVNGVPPYQITWKDGLTQLSDSLVGLSKGTYQYTVVDVTDCHVNGTVEVEAPDSLIIDAVTTPEYCYGSAKGSITVNIIGGTSPFEYDVYNLDQANFGYQVSSSSYVDTLTRGHYGIYIQDANLCYAEDEVEIVSYASEVTTNIAYQTEGNDIVITEQGSSLWIENISLHYIDDLGNTIDADFINDENNQTLTVVDANGQFDGELIGMYSLINRCDLTSYHNIYTKVYNDKSGIEEGSFDVSEYKLPFDSIARLLDIDFLTIRSIKPSGTKTTGGYDVWVEADTFYFAYPPLTSLTTTIFDGLSVIVTDTNDVSTATYLHLKVEPTQYPIMAIGENRAVSPNGDSYNRYFTLKNMDYYPNNEVSIFTKWGDLLIEYENYGTDDLWQGLDKNGNEVPSGSYYYVYVILSEDGKQVLDTRSGFIELRR